MTVLRQPVNIDKINPVSLKTLPQKMWKCMSLLKTICFTVKITNYSAFLTLLDRVKNVLDQSMSPLSLQR